MAGAASAIGVLYLFSSYLSKGLSSLNLVVGGAALNAALASSTMILLVATNHFPYLRSWWTIGSLSGANRNLFLSLLPLLIAGMLMSLCLARDLNLLGLGDETAVSLGTNPRRW